MHFCFRVKFNFRSFNFFSDKIEYYLVKLSINLMLICFFYREPHNKLIEKNILNSNSYYKLIKR